MPSVPDALLGRVITSVALHQEGYQLRLETDEGVVLLSTQGDCCSHSWIESLDDPEALLGLVTAVENLTLNKDATENESDEVIQYYGLKITTTNGRCVIDYRNASNGYYGGWIEVDESP